MKFFLLILFVIALFSKISVAQTGGLNFQGVARNSSGSVVANQRINLKFSIIKTSENGVVEYTEINETTTNVQGIFSVVIGEVNTASFASIDWKQSPKFLKIEMDFTGGTNFVLAGITRLQNVPFAYYANGVNSNNIDGTVAIEKGGTGAITAAEARSNLGLVIGTNVQAPLRAGTDYLTPTGSASGLTSFPTLNQSTTGNAATATRLANAKKINGIDFDGSTDITVAAEAGTLSGTVAIAKGGTGATTASEARSNLGLVIGTNVQAPLRAGTDYLIPTGSASGLTSFPTLNQSTTGNAATATRLANAKKINGIDFDGSADITVAAEAGTLSGTVLNSSVTSSSLSSLGSLTDVKIISKVLVGTSSATSNSALVEINSTNQGFLPSRMTLIQRDSILNPAQGLIVFCNDCGISGEWQGYNGIQWTNLSGTGGAEEGLVSIGSLSDITGTSVKANLQINTNNSLPITEYGICLSSTNTIPSILDRKVVFGSVSNVVNGISKIENYVYDLSKMTKYNARPYAINSNGYISYGNVKTFYTTSPIKESLMTGLMAFYPFNGNSRNVTNPLNNGANYGGKLTEDRFDNANSAMYYDGNSYTVAPLSNSSPQLALSVWFLSSNTIDFPLIKPSPLDFSIVGFANNGGVGTDAVAAFEFGGYDTVKLYAWNYPNRVEINANQISIGTWHNVLYQRSSDFIEVYYDGILQNRKNVGTNSQNLTDLVIGKNSTKYQTLFFTGKIDDVGVWNRILTSDEINFLYQNNFQP